MVTDKDQRKTVLALQDKLEASRVETNALRKELNQTRTLAADKSVEKLGASLDDAGAKIAALEKERDWLLARVDERTATTEKRELDLGVLQNVIERAVTQLAAHAKPDRLWTRFQ